GCLQDPLLLPTQGITQLWNGGRAAELMGEPVALPAQHQRALLKVARNMDRPALVTEMPLELAQDRGNGIAGKAARARQIKMVDGLDQPEAGHLYQVLVGLLCTAVAQRQLACQRHEPLDQSVTIPLLAVSAVCGQELVV